jgi:uncharacterized membrane-anchored protein YjiN (DUF445 family)
MSASTEAMRARGLQRMRWVATGLLGLMAVVFVLASLFAGRWTGLAYVRAFAEAAMVGACADWFAVTALFRRPFNLPIPHTGIIPRSKDRIGEALGEFIAENFLTEAVLDAKLRQLEIARWGAGWLRQPDNARRLAVRITAAIPQLVELAPVQARRELITVAATGLIRAIPAAPLAATILGVLWSGGRAQPLLDRGLDLLAGYLAANEPAIRSQVRGRALRWAPAWLDRRIGDKVVAALADIVGEMRDPEHPWRLELEAGVTGFIERLRTDPELRAKGEELKAALLKDPGPLVAHLEQAWTRFADRLRADGTEGQGDLAGPLARAIVTLGGWLDADADSRATLNAWARAAAGRLIAPQRHVIGRFIAQVVAGWDTRSIVEKLELQVGRDLQYIRVNGTLVGGLVGLLIFVAARRLGLG